ncbi:hypothetical protein UMM65_07955 [Aureibaculum sp. 2210JD6-5]|uniref:hypothetical protein n=1 Tax=Aureibaculum sp. 2210JD6-5 TaxID=3103957 RepID=UPI002AAD0E6B|nr:hypothetical protein [Aureibaculum sp. 2210JD6-5]MDY7395173.1 hypothetical protein [Aureibaculum sp. 2210JD6-5]
MKRIQYKIALLIVFISTDLIAQNHRRTYNEEFSTNKDVVIEVNTRNTDVQIETWNKNKVSVEAIIEVEGVEDVQAERTLDNWKFKAVGNKSEVEISAKSSGASNYLFSSNDSGRVIINGQGHNDLDYHFDFPEIELDNLIELSNDIMVFPEPPEMPNIPMVEFHIENTFPKFDYEKFKKDKDYLKKWQKEMEENLEKNKIKWEKNTEKVKENEAVLKVELEKMAEQRKKHAEQRKELMEKQLAQSKEHAKQREKQIVLRKKHLAKRKEDVDRKRNIIFKVLEDREKIKAKRTIIIKAPKDAKFKMNVKYGTLSFPN